MTKVTSIAVFDDSRRVITGFILDATESNEEMLLNLALDNLKHSMEEKDNIKEFSPTVTAWDTVPSSHDEKSYVIPYVSSKATVTTKRADGTTGPSAHVWFCYINDKALSHDPSYIVTVFNVDRYPYPPLVFMANNRSLKNQLVRYQRRVSALIAGVYKEEYQNFKYYERCNIKDYALMIYDPREKDPIKSIKGRIYSVQLQ